MKVISIIALLAYSVFADTIYLKNGDKIEKVTLTEITQTDIKYKVEGRAVVYTISKYNAEKVIYNDGSEDIFQLLEQPIVSNMLEDSRDGKTYKTVKMPDSNYCPYGEQKITRSTFNDGMCSTESNAFANKWLGLCATTSFIDCVNMYKCQGGPAVSRTCGSL